MVYLRAGYKSGYDLDGLTFGAGFQMKSFRLDYSVGLESALELPHRISVSYKFGAASADEDSSTLDQKLVSFQPEGYDAAEQKEKAAPVEKPAEKPVKAKGVRVEVNDVSGDPLSKSTVKISQGETVILKTAADENGEITFKDLPAGEYTVKAWKRGYTAEEKKVKLTAKRMVKIVFGLEKE
jgi:hypothetical protein